MNNNQINKKLSSKLYPHYLKIILEHANKSVILIYISAATDSGLVRSTPPGIWEGDSLVLKQLFEYVCRTSSPVLSFWSGALQ